VKSNRGDDLASRSLRRYHSRAAGETAVHGSQIASEADLSSPDTTGLVCCALHDYAPKLVPARPSRTWMDEFPDRHIYRCRPVAIANSFGWDLLCPVPFEIEWNGGQTVKDLTVRALKELPGGRSIEHFCKSHFSSGIATMHPDYIFRTDPGWSLVATGPFNHPKSNAMPLTGIIETDCCPTPSP
jgi:hypothetical protein